MPAPTIDVALVAGPVDPSDGAAQPTAACGAECIFIGRTRADRTAMGNVTALDYEAYDVMAVRTITAIAERAAGEHGCAAIAVRHSTGRVDAGDPSVVVRVLAGHRDAAFAACRAVIDRLKREAPIWKRELCAGGERWQDGHIVTAGGGP